jgi:alpha-L-fucosidase
MKRNLLKDTMVSSANDWRATAKPGKIYLIIFNWPTTGKIETPAIQGKITKAYLLAERKGVEFHPTETGVSISLPKKSPDAIASVICLETAL